MELSSVGTSKDPLPPIKRTSWFLVSLKAPMTILNTDVSLRRLRIGISGNDMEGFLSSYRKICYHWSGPVKGCLELSLSLARFGF